jgi:hypothetical protein
MRTVTENLKNRLILQSEEAEIQGLTKIASHLIDQAEILEVRANDDSYTYSNDDFQNDVENSIWRAVVRFADFHNVGIDAMQVQDLVEKVAFDLISELRVKTGTIHGIGAFEPTVSGEERQIVILNVEENE